MKPVRDAINKERTATRGIEVMLCPKGHFVTLQEVGKAYCDCCGKEYSSRYLERADTGSFD